MKSKKVFCIASRESVWHRYRRKRGTKLFGYCTTAIRPERKHIAGRRGRRSSRIPVIVWGASTQTNECECEEMGSGRTRMSAWRFVRAHCRSLSEKPISSLRSRLRWYRETIVHAIAIQSKKIHAYVAYRSWSCVCAQSATQIGTFVAFRVTRNGFTQIAVILWSERNAFIRIALLMNVARDRSRNSMRGWKSALNLGF